MPGMQKTPEEHPYTGESFGYNEEFSTSGFGIR